MIVVIAMLLFVGIMSIIGIRTMYLTRHHDTFRIDQIDGKYVLMYNWNGTWFKDSVHKTHKKAEKMIQFKRGHQAKRRIY